MTGVLVWVGLAMGVAWTARCLQVGCARMVPVAGLLTGVCALATPPGRVLQAGLADVAVLVIRIVAWATGPLLAAGGLAWLMVCLGRHPARPGSVARRVTVPMVALLGVAAALLVADLLYPAIDAAAGAGAEAAWWAAVRVLSPGEPEPAVEVSPKLPWAPPEVARSGEVQ